MPLEISEPFVDQVYDLIGRGKLAECRLMLRDILNGQQITDLHAILDLDYQTFLPNLAEWLESGISDGAAISTSIALSLSMGEFEINSDTWSVSAILHEDFNEPIDKYSWFAEDEGYFLCDCYEVSGLQKIKDCLEKDYNWCLGDDIESSPPYNSVVFTAACYLLFVLFLEAIRDVHENGLKRKSKLSGVHIFGSYGDCLYHSPLEIL